MSSSDKVTVIVPTPIQYRTVAVLSTKDCDAQIRKNADGGNTSSVTVKIGDLGSKLFDCPYPKDGAVRVSPLCDNFDRRTMLVEKIVVDKARITGTDKFLGVNVETPGYKSDGTKCQYAAGNVSDRINSKSASYNMLLSPDTTECNRVVYEATRNYSDNLFHMLGDITPQVISEFAPDASSKTQTHVTPIGPIVDLAYETLHKVSPDVASSFRFPSVEDRVHISGDIAKLTKVDAGNIMATMSKALIDPSGVTVTFSTLDGSPIKPFNAVIEMSFIGVPRTFSGWVPSKDMNPEVVQTCQIAPLYSSVMANAFKALNSASSGLVAGVNSYMK